MKLKLVVLLVSVICFEVVAHPVIWKNGIVMSTTVTSSTNELKTHYSMTHKWALGLHGISFDEDAYGMIQNNILLKRWNAEGAQGNLYVFSGVGASITQHKESIIHLGAQADWETRFIYTHFNVDSYFKKKPIYLMRARVGVAPYLAEYDGIHTWLILQGDGKGLGDDIYTTITPVLRIFRNNILVEVGSNFVDRYLMTFMVHI